jgi:hypothetical protein
VAPYDLPKEAALRGEAGGRDGEKGAGFERRLKGTRAVGTVNCAGRGSRATCYAVEQHLAKQLFVSAEASSGDT